MMNQEKEYISELIRTKPRAITGNSFYNCVGGLICDECKKDTNLCKCPKTLAEAEEMKKKIKRMDLDQLKRMLLKI